MTIKVGLPDGSVALVDDEDKDAVLGFAWQVKPAGERKYVRRQRLQSDDDKLPFWIMLHRVIVGFPAGDVDHVNGDGLDNRRSNLRLCSRAENTQNQRLRSSNRSGFKGVSFSKKRQRWQATISSRGRWIWLGYHDTPQAAALAYNEAAIEHHGEFARLNQL